MNGADIKSLVQLMHTSADLDASIINIVGTTLLVGGIIMVTLVGLKVGWTYMVNSFKVFKNLQMGGGVDYMEYARILFMAFLLVTYTLWMTPLVYSIKFLCTITSAEPEAQRELATWKANIWMVEKVKANKKLGEGVSPAAINYILTHRDEFSDEGVATAEYFDEQIYTDIDLWRSGAVPGARNLKNFDDRDLAKLNMMRKTKSEREWKDMAVWDKIANYLENFGDWTLSQIGWSFANNIKAFISTLFNLLWSLTVIVGPLAIAFSVIFQDLFVHWLKIFLNAGFALLTLRIINILEYTWVHKMVDFASATGSGVDEGIITDSSAFNISFSFILPAMYLMTYKITSWYIGKAEVGALAQKGVQLGGMAIGAMVATAMMAKGGSKAGKGFMDAAKGAAKGGQKGKGIISDD